MGALAWPASRLGVRATVCGAMWRSSGLTSTWQVTTLWFGARSVIVNVMVEGACAPSLPHKFLTTAETTQVELQRDESTETTV